MRHAALLGILLSIGCASAPQLDGGWSVPAGTVQHYMTPSIRIDPSIEAWASQFLDAVEGWRSLGVDVKVDDTAPRFVTCATTEIGGVMVTGAAGTYADCAWLALDGVSDHLRTHTFAHELGHFIGLQHVPDPNALMYFESSDVSPNAFSQDDVDEFDRDRDAK